MLRDVEKDRRGGWRRRENTRFSRRHGAESTSRYRNSPICRQRKIPEDSAKRERERESGVASGLATLRKGRETENWRRGETRSVEGSLFVEDSFREDAIILFQQLCFAITNTVLITRVYIFLDGKETEKERKAFERFSFQREFYRAGNLSSRTKSIWRDERRLKYHPSRYFRRASSNGSKKGENEGNFLFGKLYSLISRSLMDRCRSRLTSTRGFFLC